jgi:hypothetical protein
LNVTDFIGPSELQGPTLQDTINARGDSMRVRSHVNVLYDNEDNLHCTFVTNPYYFYRGLVNYHSWIYHYCREYVDGEDNPYVSLIIDDRVGRYADLEAWGMASDEPSLYHDPDTGILWCVFQRASNAITDPDSSDRAGGFANRDVYVTASPPGEYQGRMWAEAVNITNTQWDDRDVEPEPGESRNERFPTVALDSHGDYLHISYLLDLDPGVGSATEPEGVNTDNPMVYHRVLKQAIIEHFTAWVHNYPMHKDSTGYWEADTYDWSGFFTPNTAVDEVNELVPGEFELAQNYPNPFNPSTRIEFTLQRAGMVHLAVHDILGREVATLVNRSMLSGSHSVTFDAAQLPSGVYFYTLTSGSASQTKKMVLMK